MPLQKNQLHLATDDNDQYISIEQQVEGELLLPATIEQQEAIKNSQQKILRTLEKLNIPTSTLSEYAINALLTIDPGLLEKIDFSQGENNNKRARGLWPSVTGLSIAGASGRPGGPLEPNYQYSYNNIIERGEYGKIIREAILFDSNVHSSVDAKVKEDMQVAALETELVLHPPNGLLWIQRCKNETNIDLMKLLRPIVDKNFMILTALKSILTQSELEDVYCERGSFSRVSFANAPASSIEQHLEIIGKLHRETVLVEEKPKSKNGRDIFDLDDDEEEYNTTPQYKRRLHYDVWNEFDDHDVFSFAHIEVGGMNAALGVARYFINHPDRLNKSAFLLRLFLGTIKRHPLDTLPNEVKHIIKSLLQEPEAIAAPELHEYKALSKHLPKELRDTLSEIKQIDTNYYEQWQQRNGKKNDSFDFAEDKDGSPSAIELDEHNAAMQQRRLHTCKEYGITEPDQIISSIIADAQAEQNARDKQSAVPSEKKKSENILVKAEKFWQDEVIVAADPFARLKVIVNDLQSSNSAFMPLCLHNTANAEHKLSSVILRPCLERTLTPYGTLLVLQLLEQISRFDPKEAEALLASALQSSSVHDAFREAFTSTTYKGHDTAEKLVKTFTKIQYASVLYPTIEPREAHKQWEKYSNKLSTPLPHTKEPWIIEYNSSAQEVVDTLKLMHSVLKSVLPLNVSMRPRSDAALREAAFTIRISRKKIILAQNSALADTDKKWINCMLNALSTIEKWVLAQRTLKDEQRTSGEEIVSSLNTVGVRYATIGDPASKEEEKSAGYMTALMIDTEAKAGYCLAPRKVQPIHEKELAERWLKIAMKGEYTKSYPSDSNTNSKENLDNEKSLQDQRDQLLQTLDNPDMQSDNTSDSEPDLPYAGLPSENPKLLAELSEQLEGDAQYIVRKVCTRFNSRYCAHLPADNREAMALRSLMQSANTSGSKNVTLRMRAQNNTVLPHISGGTILACESDAPGAHAGWNGHWSQRINSSKPSEVTITYAVPEESREPAKQNLADILHKLPNDLVSLTEPIVHFSQWPTVIQEALAEIKQDIHTQSLASIVARVQHVVHTYYEYHFIVNDPVYKEKYRSLLEKMPYTNSDRNEYVEFIHSLRESHETVQGRGVCGQLATIMLALRSLGVPAAFASGWMANSTIIDSNAGHAFVLVPMLDEHNEWIMKPIEATSGGPTALREIIEKADKVIKDEDSVKKIVSTLQASSKQEKPTEIVATTEIDLWRKSFTSVLHTEFTPNNIQRVGAVISVATIMNSKQLSLDEARLQLEQNLATKRFEQKNLTSLYHEMGYLFTPTIAKNALDLAEVVYLSTAENALLKHLVQKNSEAFNNWAQGVEDSL